MPDRIEIKRRIIEGARDGPHLLITGGVHGDEFEPMAAIRRLLRQVDSSKLGGRLVLVPVVNEAAFENRFRWAEDGLDLARVCPGKVDGSVTERTAHALAQLIGEADFYIDLHTGGTIMSVWPLAGYCLHVDPKILHLQREMAKAFNLPLVWGTSGKLQGRSLSVARDANVPAIYTEYHGSATMNLQGVEDYVDGCLNVMGMLEMIDREAPANRGSRIEYVVEDNREHAGFMQIQNPSPMAGFFEPQVVLGQRVRVDDPIGTVCDVLGDRVETIRSSQDGIVLTLRTFCRVDKDESLGVIVETDRVVSHDN